MTTNELEGRALHEAAARAMGWKKLQGSETWDDGTYLRTMDQRPLTERECLAWLRERRCTTFVSQFFADGVWNVTADGWLPVRVSAEAVKTHRCADLLEALQRLVVAVAAREQAAKGEP